VARIDVGACVLVLWDLGGDSELRSLWDSYLERCDAALFFIDFLDKTKDDESLQELVRVSEIVSSRPLGVVVNKYGENLCDPSNPEQNGIFCERSKPNTMEGLITIVERHKSDSAIFHASALQNLNVKKSMMWVISSLNQRK